MIVYGCLIVEASFLPEVFLSDLWADQDIHYPGDSWNDAGTNLYGNFKQLYLLKKQNRQLKLMLSIGGWTYSPSFHPVVVNPALRAKFVESSITLLEDYGLDGLDVDYEYPSNDAQARGYVDLLRELRQGLDRHARDNDGKYTYPLTVSCPNILRFGILIICPQIAAPCGPSNYEKLHVKEMDQFLSFWNLMSYDYGSSYSQTLPVTHTFAVFPQPGPGTASPITKQMSLARPSIPRRPWTGTPRAGLHATSSSLASHSMAAASCRPPDPAHPSPASAPGAGSRACTTTVRFLSPGRVCTATTRCSRAGRTTPRRRRW